MPMQSSTHFYVNWAKERLDEMDATLTSLEGKVGGVQADIRDKANKFLTDLRKQRDAFRDTVKKQSEANEAAWISAKASQNGIRSRPRSGNISKASASNSSNNRRHSSFKVRPS